MVVTIARQHGSGGRMIGQYLAQLLNVPFYDRELIALTAKKSGFAEEFVRGMEERPNTSLLYGIYNAVSGPSVYDRAQAAQFSVIREAAKNPCVIVGRAADCVLHGKVPCVRVFIYAPMEERIKRVREEYHEEYSDPEKALVKSDKTRAGFYNDYAEYPWGDYRNYDLMISSSIGDEETARIIAEYVRSRAQQK